MKRSGPPKRKTRLKPRNAKRAAQSFERNFGSQEFVEYTRASPCLFCGKRDDTVRNSHLLEGRKLGGRGGDVTAVGPACFECDRQWAAGPKRFLKKIKMTWAELVRRVEAHHAQYLRRANGF